jgi:hypothetical protein
VLTLCDIQSHAAVVPGASSMHATSLHRPSLLRGGDANLFLRAGLGLALFVTVTWLYWLMQFRIGI